MKFLTIVLALCAGVQATLACDLCAIYSANSARGDSSSGFLFTLNEQYTAYHTLQNEGERYTQNPDQLRNRLDSSITHLVPGYNFSPDLGINLNIPIIYNSYHLVNQKPFYDPLVEGPLLEQSGSEYGLGDVSLIGRWTPFKKVKMGYSIVFSILGGVKFPTGDTKKLDEEVAREAVYNAFLPNGHLHLIGGIHEHELSLGSGSVDGIFGTVLNLRWKRWFFNQQFQYYLRSEAHDYQFGDWLIVSGGPGAYLLLKDDYTLSLQASAFYETMARDHVFGKYHEQTGSTSWYLGPQLVFTFGDHFSAQGGVDLPLRIYNHGYQTVPDYRIRAGFKWRF